MESGKSSQKFFTPIELVGIFILTAILIAAVVLRYNKTASQEVVKEVGVMSILDEKSDMTFKEFQEMECTSYGETGVKPGEVFISVQFERQGNPFYKKHMVSMEDFCGINSW